ncbi:MAG: hypothetical protein LQ352_004647, partial [Teloschistes flavicans]
MVSWAPSKESSLVTFREFRPPAASTNKFQRWNKMARHLPKATACVYTQTADLSIAEDAIHSQAKPKIEHYEQASGCPVMREFQTAQNHHPVLASTGCTRKLCQAGRASHTDEPRIGENRALEAVETDAAGFLQELYQEHFFDTQVSFIRRYDEVLAEIRAGACEGTIREGRRHGEIGGNWLQTSTEIEFGIRRAWRNARKCIMRSHCEELKLCDLRHVTSSAEMARELVQNMSVAFNGGNVVPTEDGSVLGDPASVELTKAIIGLGWKPPNSRSRWDLLPLVVMADNDVPVMIDIPPDLGRQIHIQHPRYPAAFENLDLRWVAAPALARLGFDIGGVQYTAAPFLGWFMDAEIGVRDLADTFRYNALPDVAKALGLLDEHFKNGVESLDDLPEYERQCILTRAQTELTYAVYWSYQQAKVSMSDTLTASMKWCRYDDEFKAKNGYRLPADPYWLAPPQGSIIPVWHRGGAPNYQPKPMICKHVQDPLKAWEREKSQSFVAAEQITYPRKIIHRPDLEWRSSINDCILPAWTDQHVRETIALIGEGYVEDTNFLHAQAMNEKSLISLIDSTPPRLSVSIYFCSAGAFAEKVASKLHLRLMDLAKIVSGISVSSKIECLNELQLPPICTNQIILVVASSTGQGEVPTNGSRFIGLCDEDPEKQLHDSGSGFRYAVFGNGDSRYAATYNGAAITIERKLQRLGGLPLLGSFHQGDTALQSTALQALNPWWAKLQPTLQDLATHSPKLKRTTNDDICSNGRMLQPIDIYVEAKSRFTSRSEQLQSDFHSTRVININPPPRDDYQGTYLVTLDVGQRTYDDLACIQVLPVNAPAKVRRALQFLGVNGSTTMSIGIADTISPTYSSLLTEYVDLESPFQNLNFLRQLDSTSA